MSSSPPLHEGEVFEGPTRFLTDEHFGFFSRLSGDTHPIHHDAEYTKATRFGKPLAHGLLLASLTALGASTGRERCHGFVFVEQGSRFLQPVFTGDTIRPQLTIERIWSEGHRQFCRFRTELINQHGERVLEGFHVYRTFDTEEFKGRPK
jgi:3-hydroxybutyryl-CoA dehydratase